MKKYEGHWYSKREPHFPMPVHSDTPHPQKQEILDTYDFLMSMPIFDYTEANDWANGHVKGYRGWSSCRCCQKHNGSREYNYRDWAWPEGFRHYIADHNVIPTKDFLKEVLNIDLKD